MTSAPAMTTPTPKIKTGPVSTHLIEVRLKADFADAEGAGALALLQGLGLTAAKEVRLRRVYELKGCLNQGHIQQISRELLCDPVTQEFKVLGPAGTILNGMNHWRVEVWLKASVTDPVGDTVRKAIADMGLPQPESVRVGLAYHVNGKCAKPALERAVARSLANPVIHRFTVSEAPLS